MHLTAFAGLELKITPIYKGTITVNNKTKTFEILKITPIYKGTITMRLFRHSGRCIKDYPDL